MEGVGWGWWAEWGTHEASAAVKLESCPLLRLPGALALPRRLCLAALHMAVSVENLVPGLL